MVRNPVLEVMLLDNNEPTSYGEAMVGPYSDEWLEAMKSEIESMYQNKAWTLVNLPDDQNKAMVGPYSFPLVASRLHRCILVSVGKF